ncbi:hypothetical protein [Pectobacterium versatile]|uniref:hypothetical protein n=1 Tax=Pectobacterium versatile TaxID=2488639 RepID=UPI000D1BD43B|nr:hypothetical protein [Pectobacterium versatile]AVT59749.1 Hypothetical protein OA04_32250 [Pectobacterium versatile]
MNSIYWAISMGLLINIPSLAPVLFLHKISKKVKVSLALRLFLLNAFLVLSLVTISQNTTQKYGLFPIWLVLVAIALFVVMLVPTIKFVRKHLTVGKRRTVILSSFLIVYAVRFHSVFSNSYGSGYSLNGYNVVWTLFFLFACLLAYLGCGGNRTNYGTYIPPATAQPNGHKAYAPQSEIDTDIAVKGSSVLFDPRLDIVEQQRYRDAIEKRNNDSL